MTFPVIETSRLILRKPTQEDAEDMLVYLADEEVVKHMGLAPFNGVEDALSEIQWYDSIRREGSGIRWGIILKESGRMIGSCGFHNMDTAHFRAEVGYELSRDCWGKGIASEALGAVLRFGFEYYRLERIQALIEPENAPSQKLIAAKGFIREGLLRHYEYTNGKFDDLYMYSLLKNDMNFLD
ncbi:N-acetyltransferase [Bacillus salacetis]|uniref:N-acetyltransferase n=1 Tax=Bacillus salacetis TaxID=2315464 RepID=A0A3A1QNZ9_9BACI|nr:GNAT family N-acetyltransferase [Bacillus salacetis]RIW28782.1 N-acetyltransferase [Bacillus salacetis]